MASRTDFTPDFTRDWEDNHLAFRGLVRPPEPETPARDQLLVLSEFDPATGHHRYTQPDWEELKRVVNGDGPCNRERLEVRRRAHEEGRWVREALQVAS